MASLHAAPRADGARPLTLTSSMRAASRAIPPRPRRPASRPALLCLLARRSSRRAHIDHLVEHVEPERGAEGDGEGAQENAQGGRERRADAFWRRRPADKVSQLIELLDARRQVLEGGFD